MLFCQYDCRYHTRTIILLLPNMLLQNKIAIITGGVRGIGLAIARTFAQAGANLILTTTREPEKSTAIIEELRQYGGKVQLVTLNPSNRQQVTDVLTPAITEMGGVDILVNNAGITRDGLLLRMSEQAWDDVIQVDLRAAFCTCQIVLPYMMRRRAGSIINISSIVGVNGNAGQTNYAAAKAGLIGFTKSLAKEMGAKNIRANCIAPGYIRTEMTAFMTESMVNDYVSRIALRRAGEPEEVANVALFLASDMASYVNGQTINCCGGMN